MAGKADRCPTLHGAVWTVEVRYTSHRPVRPDEHTTRVVVDAGGEIKARTLAAQMVGTQTGAWMGRPHPEMVTSAVVVGCEV